MQGNTKTDRVQKASDACQQPCWMDTACNHAEWGSAAGLNPIEASTDNGSYCEGDGADHSVQRPLKASIKTSQRTKNDAIAISVADTAMALDVAAVIAFTQMVPQQEEFQNSVRRHRLLLVTLRRKKHSVLLL